jgi:Tfp pilus assembly protein, ATPase PilM
MNMVRICSCKPVMGKKKHNYDMIIITYSEDMIMITIIIVITRMNTITSRRTAVRQAKFQPEHASVYITRNISKHFYPYHNSGNFPHIFMKFGPYVNYNRNHRKKRNVIIMIF